MTVNSPFTLLEKIDIVKNKKLRPILSASYFVLFKGDCKYVSKEVRK